MAKSTDRSATSATTTLTDEPLILIAGDDPDAVAAPIEADLAADAPADLTAEPIAEPTREPTAEPTTDAPTAALATDAPTITIVTASAAPATIDPPAPSAVLREPTTYTVRENEVILTGRVAQRGGKDGKKSQDGRYTRLHKGGEWLEYRIVIDEEVAPGIVATTQVPIVIPRGSRTMEQSLRSSGILQIRGRLDRDTEFDTRYGKDTAQHGTIKDRMFIKVGQVDVLDASDTPRQQAIMRVSGTVQAVVRVSETLGRHDTQKFHLVRLKVVERYPRQAPATGTLTFEQTMQIAVPADDPEMLRMLLRPGNPVAVELAYREALDWLSDNHHSMQGTDEQDRDRLRKQTKSYLIATLCAPLDGATALLEAEMETLLENARKRQQQARRAKQSRTPRADAVHTGA